MVLPTLLCISCGQVYRPVVIPCTQGGVPGCPVITPPIPANFHTVFALSTNSLNNPGGALQIDVSGDSIIGETPTSDPSAPNLGDVPTHAAILPNNSRVFVASAGSVSGGVDGISSFTPASQSTLATGLGPVQSPTLPSQASSIASISEAGFLVTVTLNAPLTTLNPPVTNVPAGYWIVISGVVIPACAPPACNPNAYNGGFTLSSIDATGTIIQYKNSVSGLPSLSSIGTATFPPQPVFLSAAQNNTVYSANYNSNSVFALNTSVNAVTNSAPVGAHPVSLAKTPNLIKLYVANQGDNLNPNGSVSSLNIADLSPNTVNDFAGKNPVWVVARGDSQKVYVLTQGDGQLVTIDVATDTVTSSLPVGAGANFVFFDSNLNRLYVTNPVTSTLYVFSDTGGISPVTNAVSDIPVQLAAISFASGSTPCPAGCSPASVTALPDGSRFYVATYEMAPSCPDAVVGASSACVIPGLSVFDANSLSLKYPSTPTLNLLTTLFAAGQFAVPPVGTCVSPVLPALYAPGVTRFRVFTTAATDGSHVYVSMCDAGAIADIITSGSNTNNNGGSATPPDTVVTDLPTAFGVCSQASCSTAATITAFSITSNIVTFQATNDFTPGQTVSISGLTTGTYLNGFTLTVLATGLSNSQFECYFTNANVSLTPDSGFAVPAVPLQTPVFMMAGQ